MDEKERDEKEFEKFMREKYPLFYTYPYNHYYEIMEHITLMKESFLASRRLLREQLGKWHDVEEFYKEEE